MGNKKDIKKINARAVVAGVAVVVIVISLINVGIAKLTGYASSIDIGEMNITIEPNVKINFTLAEIDFGPGSIYPGKQNATLDTFGDVIDGNWTPVYEGFRIENIGNTKVILNLKTNKNSSEFIGGTGPVYQYNVSNIRNNSCNPEAINLGEWQDVNKTGLGTEICSIFNSSSLSNLIRIDLKLVIPYNAATGAKSDIFTATATGI